MIVRELPVGSAEDGVLRSSPVAWWRAGSLLPTTLAGVEIGLLTIFLVLRSTDLVQLAVSVPAGLQSSTAPVLDGALMTVYVAESIAIAAVSIRRRRFLSAVWTAVDLGVATVVMAAQPWFTSEATRIGTWVAWGYPIGVGAALAAGIGFPRRWQALTAVTVLVGAYLAVSLPAVGDSGELGTVWSNTFAFPAFGLFGRLLSGYLRRLGRDADQARTAAGAVGVRAVVECGYRALIYTNEQRREVLAGCLAVGAHGVIHKAEEMPALVSAITAVAADGTVITPALVGLAEVIERRGGMTALIPRQRQVLSGRARGQSFQTIADRWYISRRTAEEHMNLVAGKFADYLRTHSAADLERHLGLGPGDLLGQ